MTLDFIKKFSRISYLLNLIESNDKILDIGCTGGYKFVNPLSSTADSDYSGDHTSYNLNDFYWLHPQIKNRSTSLVGIDIVEHQINYMKSLGFSVYVENAESFNLGTKFNKIIASEVIEHLFNVRGFLNSCKLHMEKDSELIITTPSANSLFTFLYAFIKFPKTNSNQEHTHLYCINTLKYTVQEAGFKIKKIELLKDYRFVKKNFLYNLFFVFVMIFNPLLPKRIANNTIVLIATI